MRYFFFPSHKTEQKFPSCLDGRRILVFVVSVPAGLSQGHTQNLFLTCPRKMKAKANFSCKGSAYDAIYFPGKRNLSFLAPKSQWFPQTFECGTVGRLASKQNLIFLERPNLPTWIAFFAPTLLLSVFNSKEKTKRSYLKNLKLGHFYCLQLIPDKDANVKTGENLWWGISKANVWSAVADFYSGSDFERFGKCSISLSNSSLKWRSLMSNTEVS